MGEESKNTKKAQAEALPTLNQAAAAFSAGNYGEARRLYQYVVETWPATPAAYGARAQLDKLRVDPIMIYAGLFAVALLVIAWVYALW